MADERDDLVFRLRAEHEKLRKDYQKAVNHTKRLSGQLKGYERSIKRTLGGLFAAGAITAFGRSVVKTTAEFQKFEAVLSNTLGSNSEAQKAMQEIVDFASLTPFAVNEVTGSFVKLANQGFVPVREEMTKLGDLASSTGKSFDQLTEAILDAQVGEFERLKEFGIRANKQGDKVTFTFKGVKKQVDFTEESIRKYLLSLGDTVGVSGAMAKISSTVGGKLSTLNDKFVTLKNTIGDQSSGVIFSLLNFADSLIEGVNRIASGTFFDSDDPFKLGKTIGKNLQLSNEKIGKEIDKIEAKYAEMRDTIISIDKSIADQENISVQETIELFDIREQLLDQMLKARGIISSLTKRNEEYNLSLKDQNKELKNISNNMENIPFRQGSVFSSPRAVNLSNQSPLPIGGVAGRERADQIFKAQKDKIQEKYQDFADFIIGLNDSLNSTIAQSGANAISGFVEGLATKDLEKAFENIAVVFADGIGLIGKQLITFGTGMLVAKAGLKNPLKNPFSMIAVGGLMVAASAALKGAISQGAGGISSGLGGGGGSSSSFNSGITGQSIDVNITGKIKGDGKDMYVIFENEQRARLRR